MKQKIRTILALLVLSVSVLGLTACGNVPEETEITYDEDFLHSVADFLIANFEDMPEEVMAEYAAGDEEEIQQFLDTAADLKAKKKAGTPHRYLEGKNVALIFEKTSTRTRCAFEVAAQDLGMGSTYLGPTGSQIGVKESIADTARVLGRMYDGIDIKKIKISSLRRRFGQMLQDGGPVPGHGRGLRLRRLVRPRRRGGAAGPAGGKLDASRSPAPSGAGLFTSRRTERRAFVPVFRKPFLPKIVRCGMVVSYDAEDGTGRPDF